MSQKNEIKSRRCHKCNEVFELTAKEIKAHAEECVMPASQSGLTLGGISEFVRKEEEANGVIVVSEMPPKEEILDYARGAK
jgi:hypothetical protein